MDALTEDEKGTVFVEETPFYATMGGQEGDKGVIELGDAQFVVEDTISCAAAKWVMWVRRDKRHVKDRRCGNTESQRKGQGRHL